MGSSHGWRSYHRVGVGGIPTGWQCPQVVGGVSTGLAGSPRGQQSLHTRISSSGSRRPDLAARISPSGSPKIRRKSAKNPLNLVPNGQWAGRRPWGCDAAVTTCSGSSNKPIFKQHSSSKFTHSTKFIFITFKLS